MWSRCGQGLFPSHFCGNCNVMNTQTQAHKPSTTSSINPDEVEQFSKLAEKWWDPAGPFKPLHDINPLRLGFIKQHVCAHFGRDAAALRALDGLAVVDIGCGGGLICEPIARMGGSVTGIDASEKNIKTASLHAGHMNVDVNYRATTAEALVSENQQFDLVLALEIIEHVADADAFIASCAALVKPGGMLIMTTLNRTAKSFAMAIVGAEYVLRLLPRGTHDWRKFVKPADMHRAMEHNGLRVIDTQGMVLGPLKWQWRLSDSDFDVNYLMVAVR